MRGAGWGGQLVSWAGSAGAGATTTSWSALLLLHDRGGQGDAGLVEGVRSELRREVEAEELGELAGLMRRAAREAGEAGGEVER